MDYVSSYRQTPRFIVPRKTEILDIIPILEREYQIISPEVYYPNDTSINDVYLIRTVGNFYALKIYTFFKKSEENFIFEEWVKRKIKILDIALPVIVKTKSNQLYCRVGEHYAVLTGYIVGQKFSEKNYHYLQAGTLLGKLHSILLGNDIEGKSFIKTFRGFQVHLFENIGLDVMLHTYKNRFGNLECIKVYNCIKMLDDVFCSLESIVFAIIHGEYDKKTLRFTEGRISGLLDFESSRIDNPLLDLANSYWNFGCVCRDITSPKEKEFRLFVKGYRKSYSLFDDIRKDFSNYLCLHLGYGIVGRLYYYWRYRDFDSFCGEIPKFIKEIDWVIDNHKMINKLISQNE